MQAFGVQDEDEGAASVFFPDPRVEFSAVLEGTPVLHDFVIQNKGTGTLDIQKVSGG